MQIMDEIKHIEVSIDTESNTIADINSLLLLIFNEPALKIDPLGGLSNRLYKCMISSECVVIRFKSSDSLKNEVALLRFLSQNNQAASVLITFQNGYISRFIPGIPMNRTSHRSPPVLAATAKKLSQLHSIQCTEGSTSENTIWSRMNCWLDSLDKSEGLRKEMHMIKSALDALDIPIVFCHNDLACENILLSIDEKDPNKSYPYINFIDWEYAMPNYSIYDIANHFQEWAGNSLSNPLLSETEKNIFLSSYFNNSIGWDTPIFREQLRLCTLLSDLHWSIWAFHRAHCNKSSIEFDYLNYGKRRLNRSFPGMFIP